jgi:hypothetical protein
MRPINALARSPAGRRPGWRWRSWSARRRTCCCWTSRRTNLDPASREQVLGALRSYRGAIVLVTHDEGAVSALTPEKVLLLPDGVEDYWSPELADLVVLA